MSFILFVKFIFISRFAFSLYLFIACFAMNKAGTKTSRRQMYSMHETIGLRAFVCMSTWHLASKLNLCRYSCILAVAQKRRKIQLFCVGNDDDDDDDAADCSTCQNISFMKTTHVTWSFNIKLIDWESERDPVWEGAMKLVLVYILYISANFAYDNLNG